MKKRGLALLLAGVMCLSFAACGKENTSSNSTVSGNDVSVSGTENSDPAEEGLVELGQYKGLVVEATKYVPSEEELNYYIESFYFDEASAFTFNKAAEEGDSVVIDFVGKIDGEAFQGGTASDYEIVIGSHAFIDGFEDGMVGMEIGEVRDLNLRFPDDYHNADYAGKDCVFTVTLKRVTPAMSDESIKALQNPLYSNMEEFRAYQTDYVNDYFNNDYETTVVSLVLEQIVNGSTFSTFSETALTKHRERIINAYTDVAASYGLDVNTYLEYNGTSVDVIAELFAKRDLIFAAIQKAEGIDITEEELIEKANYYMAKNGIEGKTPEEYYEMQGSKESFKEAALTEKIYAFLVANTTVVDPLADLSTETVESDTTEETDADTDVSASE